MININEDLLAELESEEVVLFMLLAFDFDTPYYCTDHDTSLFYDGVKYLHHPFTIEGINFSADMSVDTMNITMDNSDRTFLARLLSEDARNKTVTASVGCLNTNHQIIDVLEIFPGILGGWDASEKTVEVTVVNEFVLWQKDTLRVAQSSCPWDFKGTEGFCGYTGSETWCDQSYDRCLELSNTDNFGGFRFMPSLEEADIWWGRVKG
jgi:phage-related protein